MQPIWSNQVQLLGSSRLLLELQLKSNDNLVFLIFERTFSVAEFWISRVLIFCVMAGWLLLVSWVSSPWKKCSAHALRRSYLIDSIFWTKKMSPFIHCRLKFWNVSDDWTKNLLLQHPLLIDQNLANDFWVLNRDFKSFSNFDLSRRISSIDAVYVQIQCPSSWKWQRASFRKKNERFRKRHNSNLDFM